MQAGAFQSCRVTLISCRVDLGDTSNSLHRKVDYWGSYRKVLEKSLLNYLLREKVLKKLKVNCFSLKKSLKTLMFNYFPEK